MIEQNSRGVFKLDADSLCKLPKLDDGIDEKGHSKCDFYNRDGGLILVKGHNVPIAVKQIPIYIKKSDYGEIIGFKERLSHLSNNKNDGDEIKISSKAVEIGKILKQKELLADVQTKYGKKNVEMATQALAGVEELMSYEPGSKKSFEQAREIVEETYKLDRNTLNSCVSELRSIDSITYNHSFGVYLLFAQALEDFKTHMDRPVFYEVFKKMGGNVNFNSNSIKNYSTAALLHDFGKRAIPKEILLKPTKLTDEEFNIIKFHPKVGVKELYSMGIDDPVFLEIVGNHHRAYLTFPAKGQSALAQICNIVDIFEACRSKRTYKEINSYNETQGILLGEKQKQANQGWDNFIFVSIMKETFPKFEKNNVPINPA